jgi:hypothetical protein
MGNGAVFNCAVCGRRTRENDTGGTGLCAECYEIAGFDNMVNDNGYKPGSKEYADALAECEMLFAKAVKKGGNGEKIKALNRFIWRE